MRSLARNGPTVASAVVLLIVFFVATARYPGIMSTRVIVDLLRDNAFLGIAAVGMTLVILSGGIDLSVGAVIGFTSVFVATLIANNGWPPAAAISLALAIGIALGSGMGWLIARFQIPSFLVTLAGMFLARGMAFVVSLDSIALMHPSYVQWSQSRALLPILWIATVVLAGILLQWTRAGRSIYAIGGGEASANLMGVPILATRVKVHAICTGCAAIAGVAHGIYTSSGNATAGTMLELDAIAAVVIGGTLLQGGYGNMAGTFVGVLLLGVIQTILNFEGTLSSWWTKIVVGGLMLAFIVLQRMLVGAVNRRAQA